jgi:hypothetical protein
MGAFFSNVLNALDLSLGLFVWPWFWVGILSLILVVGALRSYTGPASGSSTGREGSKSPPAVTTPDTAAKFLARESARYMADSIEVRDRSLFKAYENAVYAAVAARTARDLATEPGKLSEELGVNLHEYVAYTTQVLQETKARLSATY